MTTAGSTFVHNTRSQIAVWCSLNADNDRPWNVSIWLHYFPPVPVRPRRPGTVLSRIIYSTSQNNRISVCRLYHEWPLSPAIHVLNALSITGLVSILSAYRKHLPLSPAPFGPSDTYTLTFKYMHQILYFRDLQKKSLIASNAWMLKNRCNKRQLSFVTLPHWYNMTAD
jgi:hypothetical protein